MRLPLHGLLAISLLGTACQSTLGIAGAPKSKPKPAATASAKPTARATGAPLPRTTASPTPSVPMAALKGQLMVDASYVISAGGGNVISAGGANVVSAGGGNLIKVGGQVISAGGANVVSAGGANFRLLAIEVPFGAMLPAKGMAVVPMSLLTGKPLGEAVLTDGAGGYTVRVPQSETGNVRLVAAVPASSATDSRLDNPKLAYELLTTPRASEAANLIDEDTALTSHFIRMAFAARLAALLKAETQAQWDTELGGWAGGGTTSALVAPLVQDLRAAMTAARTHTLAPAKREALAERLADVIVYHTDLDKAMLDRSWPEFKSLPEQKAVPALRDLVKRFREGAIKTYGSNLAPANDLSFVKAINRLPGKAYVFEKPADLGTFAVRELMTRDEQGKQVVQLHELFDTLGVDRAESNRLMAAQYGILTTVGQTMFLNPTAKASFTTLLAESADAGS
jgi:hypothetical protein